MNVPPGKRPSSGEAGDDFSGTKRFHVLRRLGAGGMGVVYEAFDRERSTRVALKTLRTLKPDALLRFKNEFRSLADIAHPNLVTLGELFEDEGRWFFTMEMVHGVHFLEYVRRSEDREPASAKQDPEKPDKPESPKIDSKRSDPTAVTAHVEDQATVNVPSHDELIIPKPRPSSPSASGRFSAPERRSWPDKLPSGVDETRLRAALAQLAQGLAALHAAAKVHRDIKPSNIMVTRDGRLKVLDFGLVADLRNDVHESHLVGTFSYMAPEQAGMKAIGPAADWYSVGVLIYQALTGRLPVTGNPREVLVLKQAFEPPPPHAIVDVPQDLDLLCIDLLKIEPTARPSERDILRRLSADAPVSVVPANPHFVGRRSEIEALRVAFSTAKKTRPVTFLLHGESGVGKSAIVRRFTRVVTRDAPDTVTLAGRCYERENVPYKAVDGVVDALSRYLATCKDLDPGEVLPRQRGLIGQVFPVMRKVEAIAVAPKPEAGALDPLVLRARLFFAMRDLFKRLSDRRPVVMVIDDLQWADADSLALLAEIIRQPDAPKILLLATLRAAFNTELGEGGKRGAAGSKIRSVEQLASMFSGDVRRLSIEALPRDDAEMLVNVLLREAGADARFDAARVVEETGGHPLFIDELIRQRLAHGEEGGALKLQDALWARISALEEGARKLLDLIVVAGAPIVQEIAAQAMEIPFAELSRRLSILRAENLARTMGARRTDEVEPYHDRVREAVMLHMSPESERALHARIAHALEASTEPDPEALFEHWRGAGKPEVAARYALEAAALATNALAFDRAATLYALAIELSPPKGDEAAKIYKSLGEVRSNAGRGVEAADAYLAGAEHASEDDRGTLLRLAGQELLRAGRIDQALDTFKTVLASIDMELTKSPKVALASLLYHRARVRLRGLKYEPKTADAVAPETLRRIDILWSIAPALGMVDFIRGADLQARCLLLALDAGENYRVACALGAEACAGATAGVPGASRTAMLIQATEIAVRRVEQPYTMGWVELARGMAGYLEGRFRPAYEACLRGEDMFARSVGAWWETATVKLYVILNLFYLGELGEQAKRVEATYRSAKGRGDLLARTHATTGLGAMAWLTRGDVVNARAELEVTMAEWSRDGFFLAHYWGLVARVHIELYEGKAEAAVAAVEERWEGLSRSLVLRVQLILVEALHLRGRAHLALAARAARDRDRAAREGGAAINVDRLLREVERDAKGIDAERTPWGAPLATLLRAGVAMVRGDTSGAIALFARAQDDLNEQQMALYAMAAQWRRGELMGAEGAALIESARAWMKKREIEAPERVAAMLVPVHSGGSGPPEGS